MSGASRKQEGKAIAQRNDLAEKKRVYWDGVELTGLVSVSEITLEKGVIEVPEFNRLRKIQNGIMTMPEVTLVYKIQRDNSSLDFMVKFFRDDETKECEIVRCDASGVEFSRTLLQSCECRQYVEPEFDGANPTFAKVTIIALPWEIVLDSGKG